MIQIALLRPGDNLPNTRSSVRVSFIIGGGSAHSTDKNVLLYAFTAAGNLCIIHSHSTGTPGDNGIQGFARISSRSTMGKYGWRMGFRYNIAAFACRH